MVEGGAVHVTETMWALRRAEVVLKLEAKASATLVLNRENSKIRSGRLLFSLSERGYL